MIGQVRLVTQIEHQLESGRFPQFSIFTGPKGCGKKKIVFKFFRPMVVFDTTAEDIREMTTRAYEYNEPISFVIEDADNMSQAAFNAMLKVVEEPPNMVRFVLTCENIENIPTTIRSRAVVYTFDPYSYEDKCDFCESNDLPLDEFVLDVAETPGEILTISKYEGFRDYIDLVINNIASVSGANAFKIAEKIALKDTDADKYDFKLFLKAFSSVCVDYMLDKNVDNCLKFSNAVAITGEAIADLNVRGVNKQMLFDKWLLDIRSAWL